MHMKRYLLLNGLWGVVGFLDSAYARRQTLPEDIDIIRDIPYIEDGLNEHLCDLALPKGASGKLPVIVHVHGGGWVYGNKDTVYRVYGAALAKQGYAVMTINYRLAPKVTLKEMVLDVSSAIDAVSKLSDTYPLDANRVYLVGDSAGAHLCALVTSCRFYPKLQDMYGVQPKIQIKGLMLSCGVYDFRHFIERIPFPRKYDTLHAIFQSENIEESTLFHHANVTDWLHEDYPEILLVSTEMDALHPQTLEFEKKLLEYNLRYTPMFFSKKQKLPHVFNTKLVFKQSYDVLAAIHDFFV